MTPEEATDRLFELVKRPYAAACRAIEAGADVKAKDDQKMTPLHWAADHDFSELAQLVIQKGADINAQDIYLSTPLHAAAARGHSDVAQLLIDSGADINAQNASLATPLALAARNGHTDIVKMLQKDAAKAQPGHVERFAKQRGNSKPAVGG
jgi:ankyrin repeat protein